MLSLVALILAYVYPNVSKVYENYQLRIKYYDQTEDIYTLNAIKDYMYKHRNTKEMTINNGANKQSLTQFVFKNNDYGEETSIYETEGIKNCSSNSNLFMIYRLSDSGDAYKTKKIYSRYTGWVPGIFDDAIIKDFNFTNTDSPNEYHLKYLFITSFNNISGPDANNISSIAGKTSLDITNDVTFKKYLKRLTIKTVSRPYACRLIGVFVKGNVTRYANVYFEDPAAQ